MEESPVADNSVMARVFPNPGSAEITIVLNEPASGKTVSFFNANGSLVQTIPLNSGKQKVNISTFKPGLYFIKGAGFIEKFIKL